MSLKFPIVEDIPLSKPPLKEVICQVRFPPILGIARGEPVDFQEAIRERFPELEEEQTVQVRVIGSPGGQAADADVGTRVFRFGTADGGSQVTLSVDAFALATSKYTVWEDFAQDLDLAFRAAMSAYRLPYAKRVGLRYVNQFDSEHLGFKTFKELTELFRPDLVTLMATDAWDYPDELVSQILLSDGDGRLVLRVATRNPTGQPPIIVLDFDYYEEGSSIPLDDLSQRCTKYHDVIYRAFRWAIKPEMLEKFSPIE